MTQIVPQTNRDAIWRVTSGWADSKILFLWQAGENTRDIASRLTVPEHFIANRIAGILDAARAAA